MSGQYFVRVRGEIKGPVTHDQIVAQIRRKRLGKLHEISTDRENWVKAGDMPEFFQPAVEKREKLRADATVGSSEEGAADGQSGPAAGLDISPSEGVEGDQWFYAKGGNQLGPVTASEIQMWLASGALLPTDLVWNESLEDWLPANELPQFSTITAAPKPEPTHKQDIPKAGFLEVFMGTSRGAVLPVLAEHKYPNLSRYLRIAEAIVRIMFVIYLLLFLAGWLFTVGVAMNQQLWSEVFIGVVVAPVAVVLLWFLFISMLAGLEFARVVINIEDNTDPGRSS